jgi:hypothetical protein
MNSHDYHPTEKANASGQDGRNEMREIKWYSKSTVVKTNASRLE